MSKELTPKVLNAFASMQVNAFNVLDRRYGPNSLRPKRYHHVGHTVLVTTSVAKINYVADASNWEKLLMATSAMFHDYIHEFGIGSGWDERLSARAARVEMQDAEIFDSSDEEYVEEPIDGSTVTLDGPCIYQKAAELGIPAQRVADADLSALGMRPEIYRPIAEALHYEHHPDVPLVGEALVRFANFQVEVLKAHEFFTPEARQLFPHKQENIAYMQYVARNAA